MGSDGPLNPRHLAQRIVVLHRRVRIFVTKRQQVPIVIAYATAVQQRFRTVLGAMNAGASSMPNPIREYDALIARVELVHDVLNRTPHPADLPAQEFHVAGPK